MKRCVGILLLLAPLYGCWSRPCCIGGRIPASPCSAEGANSEGWRIATSICRRLESAGAEVQQVYVDGAHLSLRFAPDFGQKLLAEESALRQSIAEFLSMMSEETGAICVSVEVLAGDRVIATGETTDSGEGRIKVLE